MTINVHDEVFAICSKLGLVPEHVRRMEIFPTYAVVETYLLNENGAKYVNLETGGAATEERVVQVKTWEVAA